MAITTDHRSVAILLYSQDKRLAETRQLVLEQAGFRLTTALNASEFDSFTTKELIALFILCNSLTPEIRNQTIQRIHSSWPMAKLLLLLPSYPVPVGPSDEVFSALDGPAKLIQTIGDLVARSPTLSPPTQRAL